MLSAAGLGARMRMHIAQQRRRAPQKWQNQQQQRRTLASLPRATLSLLRVPLAAAGAGMGVSAYVHYRFSEFSRRFALPDAPDWLQSRIAAAAEWIDGIEWDAPEFLVPLRELDPELAPEQLAAAALANALPATRSAAAAAADRVRQVADALFRKADSESSAGDGGDNDTDSDQGEDGAGQGPSPSPRHPPPAASAAAAAAAVLALGSAAQTKSSASGSPPQNNHDMLGLTSKLIEIRNLLKTIDTSSSALKLPGIVVIGSQSSGKSSVLEAIVGHEFLPKGSNMVTRRPIELTLFHTLDAKEDYSEFPQLGLGKVKDFAQVRRTLTDLNLAVSETECVSEAPIELHVYSAYLPDLSLVDLPGYIQVHTRNQPPVLKQKIMDLCNKYIQEPNIILAVCAADVDLANSEALRASRRVDPLGLRTIGVVTKLDLVSSKVGTNILENKDYPLALGYVGMVNKSPSSQAAAASSALSSRNSSQALVRPDDSFFQSNPEYAGTLVGTSTLRHRLMQVLEQHMGRSLYSIVDAVQMELDNARYEFKVHYNDRRISPESYVAESMDILKQRFKSMTQEFGKPQLRERVRAMLEEKLLRVCSDVYWSDEFLTQLPRDALTSTYWQNKLDESLSALTKSGVGKASVQLVVDMLTSRMEEITSMQPWNFHSASRQQILQFSADILRSKFHTTVDQVENTIKPYKFEVECTELEWRDGQRRAAVTLEKQLSHAQQEVQAIKSSVGRRRLRNAIKQLTKAEHRAAATAANSVSYSAALSSGAGASTSGSTAPATASSDTETQGGVSSLPTSTAVPPPSSGFTLSSLLPRMFSSTMNGTQDEGNDEDDLEATSAISPGRAKLMSRAQQALELQSSIATMQQRLSAVKSRQCSSEENKVVCPEVYLSVVSEKLAYTAVMFIYIELVNEYFFHLPREIDDRLYYGLSREQIRGFARENPVVRKHLDVQDRKATLAVAMEKLKEVMRSRK